MEVLFTLLAEHYERRSVMITSNLVFSQWNQIFHDDMTATAAIDRVVHHSVIMESTRPSYRAEAARARTQGESGDIPGHRRFDCAMLDLGSLVLHFYLLGPICRPVGVWVSSAGPLAKTTRCHESA